MIVFDSETTGLLKPGAAPLAEQPYIIELYAAKLDANDLTVVEDFHRLVKPPLAALPEKITEITGLTMEMLKDALPFSAHYQDLVEFFLGQRSLIAHNCPYDAGMLANELRRLDKLTKFPWPYNHICTVELTVDLSPSGKFLKLGELYQILFRREFSGAHRTKGDVMALVECIRELRKRDARI